MVVGYWQGLAILRILNTEPGSMNKSRGVIEQTLPFLPILYSSFALSSLDIFFGSDCTLRADLAPFLGLPVGERFRAGVQRCPP